MSVDPRVVRVGVTINDELRIYEGLAITAQGSKYASATQNETTIKIANLDKLARDFLATEGTPFNRVKDRPRQKVFIEAGRISTGVARIFVGDITLANLAQPPDIWTVIKAVTGQFQKGNVISTNEPAISSLSSIAKKSAGSLGVSLQFEADDKQIANYGFTGAAEKQIGKIADLGNVDAFLDDETLVVKNSNAPLSGRFRIVSAANGMVGMPEFTDFGVKVRFLFDIQTKIGDELEIQSEVYPAANGRYIIYKLDFDIANRDNPFYYIAEARRPGSAFSG